MRQRPYLLLALLFSTSCGPEPRAPQVATVGRGMFSQVNSFGSDPGNLNMYKYVPASAPQNAPLVVAMHPCSVNATQFQAVGWNELADQWGFYVLYPEQNTSNNALRCFNWAGEFGDPTNLTRGEGENQSIIQMIDQMKADHSIDDTRVVLMGHSGGAAQVSLMMATWPEVFAGGAIIAGIPYNCTTTFTEVSTCLNPGLDKTPADWGMRVRDGNPGYNGPYPKVSIWHGSADSTVAIRNMNELLEQWTEAHGVDRTSDNTITMGSVTKEQYQDGGGQVVVETVLIQGMGHGTPIDSGNGCGSAGAFFLDVGVCAAAEIGRFFGLDGGGMMGDRTPPTISITAPSDGQTVMGNVMITTNASDDVGVASVEFTINGTLRESVTAAPFVYSWNTAAEANGQYTISAVAIDAAGNRGNAEITVTVAGAVDDMTAPSVDITAPMNGATVSGSVMLSAAAMDDFGVTRVQFFVDTTMVGEATTPPYEVSWNSGSVNPGMHSISARAFDAAGNEGRDEDTIINVEESAEDTTPPMVSFSDPSEGSVLTGFANITVEATDDVGTTQVLLFAGDDLIGTDFRAPYEFLWDTSIVPPGAYTLSARAFDAAGNLGQAMAVYAVEAPSNTDGGPGGGEPRYVGNRHWGCTASPSAPEGAVWLLLIFVGFLARRKEH